MTALPADIARFTNDGQLVTRNDPTIKAVHANAQDVGTNELDTFFDSVDDTATMLDLRFALLSMIGRTHDGIQIDDTLHLGTSIPLAPIIPRFRVIDAERGINGYAAVVAYSFDMGSDSYAVELAGALPDLHSSLRTWDTTDETIDSGTVTLDEA